MASVQERRIRVIEVTPAVSLTLRPLPAVRLRLGVPLRGGLPAGRAPGRRTHPRPVAARRAPRARPTCATCSSPTRSPRSWPRSSTSPRSAAHAAPRTPRTCCAVLGPLGDGRGRRFAASSPTWLEELEAQRRVLRTRVAGRDVWAGVEDAARLRDGLGAPIPAGRRRRPPPAGGGSAGRPDRRATAGTHGPFTVDDVVAGSRPSACGGRPAAVDQPGCRQDHRGLVRPGRPRPAVVPPRCPAADQAPVGGPAAPADRAGVPGGPGHVPAALAEHRAPRHRPGCEAPTGCCRRSGRWPGSPSRPPPSRSRSCPCA